MKKVDEIKNRINNIINKRLAVLDDEINQYEQLIYGEESYYGLDGGHTTTYRKCIQRRKEEIDELVKLLNCYNTPLPDTTTLKRYYYKCSCGNTVTSAFPAGKDRYFDCPYCEHGISSATESYICREIVVPPMPSWWDEGYTAWKKHIY